MIKARKASVLVIGAMAAVAIGSGVALASSGGDDTPSRAAVADTLTDAPSPSASADDSGNDATDDRFDAGLGTPDSPSADPSPSASSSPSASAPSSGGGSAISAAQARTIALRAAGGGRVTDIERESEHGRAVWDVEVYRGGVEHDIDVDRATGDVLRHRTDRDDDRGGDDRGRGGDDDDHDDDHGSGGHGSDD